jgi:hypothetical protein
MQIVSVMAMAATAGVRQLLSDPNVDPRVVDIQMVARDGTIEELQVVLADPRIRGALQRAHASRPG